MRASTLQRLSTHLCLVLVGLFADAAVAQTDSTVLLESFDKSLSFSGELVEAVDGQYQLKTIAGIVAIDVNAVSCTGEACPLVLPIFRVGAQVRLTSSDGAISVTGKLIDIIDDHYLVDNAAVGKVQISTDLVDCFGLGCPTGLRFADKSTEVVTSDSKVQVEAEAEAKAEAKAKAKPLTTEQFDSSDASISFAGSNTVGIGLIPFLLEGYAKTLDASADTKTISETETVVRYLGSDQNTISSMYISSTESSDATDALETKAAVFGMTSRQINNDEARQLVSAGLSDLRNSDYESVIAVDSVAVITHPSNLVREISMAELGEIYLGQIDNWSQVGGHNAPITVLSPEKGSGTRSVFEAVVFDDQEPDLADRVSYVSGDSAELVASVNNDPLAIGYASFASSDGLNRLGLTNDCGITSNATSFAVKTEDYPLGRRIYLYSRADNSPEEAKRFVEYVTSPDADAAIAMSRFVNFAVERTALDPSRYDGLYEGRNEQSLAQLTDQNKDDLKFWDRFSTTVRFESGSFILGKKEQNDIDRLVRTISELPEGSQIAVVGFTDDVGLFEDNLRLLRLRAQTVTDAINSKAGERAVQVQINTRYFSERYASVCNAHAYGRANNRRVEIWMRK